ncbi:MAG: DUF429 domain-containing protein [Firmicutes bacterium]|nr:DUF429 domain-containing protein [Bacillota bacterium]
MELEVPFNTPIPEALARIRLSLQPWVGMWPWYKVRIFAVKFEDQWRLVHGGWAGRFTYDAPLDHHAYQSRWGGSLWAHGWYSAAEAEGMLDSIAKGGSFPLALDDGSSVEIRVAQLNPMCNANEFWFVGELNRITVHDTSLISDGEPSPWRLFSGTLSAGWFDKPGDPSWHAAIHRLAIEWGEPSFDELLRHLFGDGAGNSKEMCVVGVDFPLGLSLSPRRRDQNRVYWRISCQPPLRSVDVRVFPPHEREAVFNPHSEPLPVKWHPAAKGHPEVGDLTTDANLSRLFVEVRRPSSALSRSLVLQLQIDGSTPYQQLRALVATKFYQRGEKGWKKAVFEGKDAAFEAALANLFATLGYPVLFGGQVPGLQTPGIDLMVLDSNLRWLRRAALISCKGGQGAGGRPYSFGDRHTLAKVIMEYQKLLPGWQFTLILATHLTPPEQQAQWDWTGLPVPCQVWTTEDLEALFQARTHHEVDALLWGNPLVAP